MKMNDEKNSRLEYSIKLKRLIEKLIHRLRFETNCFILITLSIERFIKQNHYRRFNSFKKLEFFLEQLMQKLRFKRFFNRWLSSIKAYNKHIQENIKKQMKYYLQQKKLSIQKQNPKKESFVRRVFNKACAFTNKMKASVKNFFNKMFCRKKENDIYTKPNNPQKEQQPVSNTDPNKPSTPPQGQGKTISFIYKLRRTFPVRCVNIPHRCVKHPSVTPAA